MNGRLFWRRLKQTGFNRTAAAKILGVTFRALRYRMARLDITGSTDADDLSHMRIDTNGWLSGVRRIASPNYDRRPPGTKIDLLVIHNISLPPDQFGGLSIVKFFTNQLDIDAHPYYAQLEGVKVSSHFLIRRDGQIVQFVPAGDAPGMRALRAGRGARAAMIFPSALNLKAAILCLLQTANTLHSHA